MQLSSPPSVIRYLIALGGMVISKPTVIRYLIASGGMVISKYIGSEVFLTDARVG